MTTVSLPEKIGPYRVLRPIARGGMAEVYEVEDPVSGEHLAVKLLVQTGSALPRFNREYEAMIRLNHPNIVRVYHYGLMAGSPWLTMELIEGMPMQGYAKKQGKAGTPKRNAEVLRLAHDLALALDHIHRRGLVHRDLKSTNVLVLPDGRVKLIDFGTARVSNAVEEITRAGEFIGTFAYASPEQLTQAALDHRSDLYSLGILLYRLATGKRPFNAKDLHALARQHVKEAPRPPRQLTPSLPQGLEDLILSLLAKKPADRPSSGAEVANTLEQIAGKPLFLSGQLQLDLVSESLVGRESQMAALLRFLDDAESSEFRAAAMTLITGLQGSGRHRVLGAIEKDMATREWRVLNWWFHREGDPLDTLGVVLAELVRSLADDAGALGAKRALGRVSQLPIVVASARIGALVKAGAALLTLRAHKDDKPVAIVLRGLHNAGAVGIEVLVQLQAKLRIGGVRVVFVGDLLATHDDRDSLTRIRLPDVERIPLPPLGIQQVALLVGSLLKRRPPPGSLARQIHEASGGMPAYVEEVVRGMVEGGLLRVQGRDPNRIEWAQQEDLEVPIPKLARKRVVEALAELAASRRRPLETIALLDGHTTVGVIAGALEVTVEELAEPLADLRRRGWVVIDEGAQQLIHLRQLLAESVVLDQMHPCRRRLLERKLVTQVASDPAFAAQIDLLIEVGRHDDAMDRALDWSVYHIAKNNPETALRVLDRVIPHAIMAPIGSSDKARLYLMHVTALLMARPTDPHTSRSLVQASKLGRGEGEHFEAELHLLRARVQRVIGHYPNFRKHLMEAWYLVEHAPPTSLAATVADLLGWSNRAAGAVDAAATWHGRSRRIAVQLGVPAARAHADVGVAGWQFARGLLYESEATASAAIAVFKQVNDLRGLSHAVPIWAASLREQGRYSEALEVLNQLAPRMRESESPSLYVRCVMATAWAEVDVCRLGRAQECVDELAATLRKGEHLDLRLQADLVWGRILLASGQHQEAIHRLHHVCERAKNAGLRIIAASAKALVGEVLWQMGDEKASQETLDDAIASLERAGHVPATAAACASKARAMGHRLDARTLFKPVLNYIESQPCVALHMEGTLASVRFAAVHKQDTTVFLQRAIDGLDRISQGLSDTDRAAIDLHPWSREVRVSRGRA